MTFADELSLRATLATCGTRAGFAEPGRQTMIPMLTQSIPQTVNHHFSLLISACKPQNIQKIFLQNKSVHEVHELSPQYFRNQCTCYTFHPSAGCRGVLGSRLVRPQDPAASVPLTWLKERTSLIVPDAHWRKLRPA